MKTNPFYLLSTLLFISLSLQNLSANAADWSADGDKVLNWKFGVIGGNLQLNSQFIKPHSGTELRYNPNTVGQFSLGLGYRNLGFGVSTSTSPSEETVNNLGQTKGIDYQVKLFGKKMTHEFYYQQYTGYFLENSVDVDSSYSGRVDRIKRPDIKTKKIGLNLIYNFQPDNMSLNAGFSQGAIQKNSSGSFLGVLMLSNNGFVADSRIIPAGVAANYGQYGDVKEAEAHSVGLGIGYGFNLVFGGAYFAGQLLLGGASQDQILIKEDNSNTKKILASSFSNLKLGTGYNGKNHYWGFQLLTDGVGFKSPDDKFKINSSSTNFSAFYGYRMEGVNLPFLNPISSLFD